mmetsp:Transcript_20553/g.24957  ORF Transcript_20553/g.24957 Transcript_20553/m.24957 type:complete len:81 (-) Transcript_20553:62-304(-)
MGSKIVARIRKNLGCVVQDVNSKGKKLEQRKSRDCTAMCVQLSSSIATTLGGWCIRYCSLATTLGGWRIRSNCTLFTILH